MIFTPFKSFSFCLIAIALCGCNAMFPVRDGSLRQTSPEERKIQRIQGIENYIEHCETHNRSPWPRSSREPCDTEILNCKRLTASEYERIRGSVDEKFSAAIKLERECMDTVYKRQEIEND